MITDEMVEAAWKVYAAAPIENGWKAAMRAALEAAEAARPRPEAFTIEATPEAWSRLFCVPPSPPIQLPAPKGEPHD